MTKSITLWILGCIIGFFGMGIVYVFESLLIVLPFITTLLGIIAYYALKAERKEKHGILNKKD